MTEQYDSIVIGTGQSGPSLAVGLAGAGRKTAIVERTLFGGTCVNTGCIPTKTLIASARVAHLARRAADFGVAIDGTVRVDMARVKARKDEVVRRSSESVERWLKSTPNLTVYQGHAHLEGPHVVRVGDALLAAGEIFLNVGARAHVPGIPGLDQVDYLTNSTMMELGSLPEHLLVIGGGSVGLEFAQMYRRFGAEVTIVEMGPRLIGREDEDVSAAVREILEGEGIRIRLDAKCVGVARRETGVAVSLECREQPHEIEASHLLLAVGRQPNTNDLGLDKAQVKTDARGYVMVDDELRTSMPGIWALGDVNGRGAFTHTSYNDFEVVAANLLGGQRRVITDRIPAHALFIDPPLGRAGMTEREVSATGRPALVARMPMTRVGRATHKSETQGFMKVLADAATHKILGAALLGIECDEVIHSILDVMYAGAPYTILERAMHIHPTVSEFIPTMLGRMEPLRRS